MKERAKARGCLFETYNDKNKNLNMMKATKQAIVDYVDSFKESGMKESEAVKYLNEEEKEQYDYAKF